MVIIWPSNTEQIDGTEEMHLVEKIKQNTTQADGCNMIDFSYKEYISPKLF